MTMTVATMAADTTITVVDTTITVADITTIATDLIVVDPPGETSDGASETRESTYFYSSLIYPPCLK